MAQKEKMRLEAEIKEVELRMEQEAKVGRGIQIIYNQVYRAIDK